MTPALVAYFIAVLAACTLALILFLRARACREPEFVAKAKVGVRVLALLILSSGFFASVVSVAWALHLVASIDLDASQKARFLAEGIAEAMNFGAFSFVAAVPTIALAVALTLRHRQMLKAIAR